MTGPRFLPFERPVDWEAVDAKWLFEETFFKGHPSEPPLSASQAFGVVPQEYLESMLERQVMSATKGLENFKLVMPDDFVISLRSFEGGLEHSRYRGIISPAYSVVRPRDARVCPGFFRHYLKSHELISRLQVVATGIRDGKTVRYDMFAELQLPLPPKSAQIAIARFLDDKTNSIDCLVAKKQRQLELLEEKRTALITHAVTKGLDSNVKMKDSGVVWLGKVPEHWAVTCLGRFARVKSGEFISNQETSGEKQPPHVYPVIGGNGIMGYCADYNEECPLIVIGRVGAHCGNVHLLDERVWVTDNALILHDMRGFRLEYLTYFLQMAQLNKYAIQTAQPLITGSMLKAHSVVLPPLEEQRSIVSFLERHTARIDALKDKIQQSIELLQEYRSALISAAVTGQIDVREEVV